MSVPSARTASRSIGYERLYISHHATYEQSACLLVQGNEGIAGITEPQLEEPIDFEAELARRRERISIEEPVDSDTANDVFDV